MPQLFTLTGSRPRDPAVDRWMQAHPGELGAIAKHWFTVIRGCGSDIRELVHDGRPTTCVGGVAFAYVDAFQAHVNIGFFRGAEIADPDGLMKGRGHHMRHVRLTATADVDATALSGLIYSAYADLKRALETEGETT